MSHDPFRLDGKRALVTGAGRGIGRAVALALAAAGAELVLVSRTSSELDAVAREIAQARRPGAGTAVRRDRQRRGARRLRRSRRARHPGQQCRPQPAAALSRGRRGDPRPPARPQRPRGVSGGAGGGPADGRRNGAKAGGGVIVNMSSQMGHVGSERDRTVYVMTKHAIEGLTKAMAVELAPKGVRVVSIAPTFIDTPLVRPFFDDPTFPAMGARPYSARPPRHRRGGRVRGRLPRLARRIPRHRLLAPRRRRLDRVVIAFRRRISSFCEVASGPRHLHAPCRLSADIGRSRLLNSNALQGLLSFDISSHLGVAPWMLIKPTGAGKCLDGDSRIAT